MTNPSFDKQHYRPAAGIAIFNDEGQVWLGRRFNQRGKYVWQFPQGGIDEGEKPIDAAIRELWEETGLKAEHVSYLGCINDWLYYEFPPEYLEQKKKKNWRGQKQKWFAYRFIGHRSDFDLKAHLPVEFSKWKWGKLSETPDLIVPFKRKVYEQLTIKFADYAKPVK